MNENKIYVISSQYIMNILHNEKDFVNHIKYFSDNNTLNNADEAIAEWQLKLTNVLPFLWIVDCETMYAEYQNSWVKNQLFKINFENNTRLFDINISSIMMPSIIMQITLNSDKEIEKIKN